MKKYIFLICLFFCIPFVSADYSDGWSYDSYSYDSGYDTYDVYDVYDVYDYDYDTSWASSSSGWGWDWTYPKTKTKKVPYVCKKYDTFTPLEGCHIEWKTDSNGCSYPSEVCKKFEPKSCPKVNKPSYRTGCTSTYHTDGNGCWYYTETCSDTPDTPTCPKRPKPTYGLGCTTKWHEDSNGCWYYTETCNNDRDDKESCPKVNKPSYRTGCTSTYHTDGNGCWYYTETCNNDRDDKKSCPKVKKPSYRTGCTSIYHTNWNGCGYYTETCTSTKTKNKYYDDYYEIDRNYYKKQIKVQGKKKVSTVESCSSKKVPLCGKKKVSIKNYSLFWTKNIEKYEEVTYTSECALEKAEAEYLYPGQCNSIDTCPMYELDLKVGCTIQWKQDKESCSYPVQVCEKTTKNTSTDIKKSTSPTNPYSIDDDYWFTPIIK